MPQDDLSRVTMCRPELAANRWRMLTIAFFVQNMVPGILFGSFGALILASKAHLATSLSIASLGMGLALLANGCIAPFFARLSARTSLKAVMLAGAGLSMAGYVTLAFADTPIAMLGVYFFLIGPGVALCGIIPSNALVYNWYVEGRGRALGIVNMPLGVMLVPVLSMGLLGSIGLRETYLCFAALHIPLIVMLMSVIEFPPRRARSADPGQTRIALAALIRRSDFWLIILSSGLIAGRAIAKSAHLAPLMIERGLDAQRAAVLLSIAGGTGIVGSPLFGVIAERLGGGLALAISAFAQAIAWIVLLNTQSFGFLVCDAIVVGACAGGYVVSTAVLIGDLYGSAKFAAVYGFVGVFTLPFLFGAAPAIAILHDAAGSYTEPFVLLAVGLGCAGIAGLILHRQARSRAGMPLAA